MVFACSRCLTTQPGDGACRNCAADEVFDLRSRRGRQFIEECEARAREKRSKRIHTVAVLFSLCVGVPVAFLALTLILWFYESRGIAPRGNTFFAIAAVLGVIVLSPALAVEKLMDRRVTSLTDGLPPADRD